MSKKDKGNIKKLPISEIKMEEGAKEMMQSPEGKLYVRAVTALLQNRDSDPAFEELRQLPLQKRYIWRVVSALKWAFVDCDTDSVNFDRQMISSEDLNKVMELLRLRPAQFCLFLKALLGEESMETIMTDAIRCAKSSDI